MGAREAVGVWGAVLSLKYTRSVRHPQCAVHCHGWFVVCAQSLNTIAYSADECDELDSLMNFDAVTSAIFV